MEYILSLLVSDSFSCVHTSTIKMPFIAICNGHIDSEKSISVDVPIHDRVNCVGRSSCFLFPLKRSYNRQHNSPECLLQNDYKRKISSYKHLDSEQNPSTIKYPSPDYHFPSKIGTAFHLLNWTGFL